MSNTTLTKGSTVEVTCDEPELQGAWYVATILDQLNTSPTKNRNSKKLSYLIKYDTLFLKQDDLLQPLTEVVDPLFVRPSPPRNIIRNNNNEDNIWKEADVAEGGEFEVGDVIDAYHRDGWWVGVVKSLIIINEGQVRKYVVLFENFNEEFVFERCELRFHVDWVDSRWIIAPKKTQKQLAGDGIATDNVLSGITTPSKGARITEVVVPSCSARKNVVSRKRSKRISAASGSCGKRFQPAAGGNGNSQDSPPETIITQTRESEDGTSHKSRKRGRPQGNSCFSPDNHGNSLSQANAGTTSDDQQDWPFIKRSPIWDTIDLYSQKPHFSPLKTRKEECREGLAIGYMVTFGNLVQRLSDLQPNDPADVLNNSLETLCDLETHGFDVNPIRARLNDLLTLKSKACQHEDMRKKVEKELQNCKHEKLQMGKEIDQLKMKMRMLKLKTVRAATMRKRKEEELMRLRSKRILVCNQISDWKLAFEKLVADGL